MNKWKRLNEEGPDGLTNREGAGRPCLLNNRQMRERARIVETGSDRESTERAMAWCAGSA